MNLKATGQDLVRTSQHMGSRPEHVPWQNKIFSYSGKSKKYPDFFKETGYGTAAGLKGVNCTHDFYPHWEGDYIPPDVEVGEEYYKNTQKQRAMERGIRATKREIEAQNTIGGDTTQLRAKLRKQEKDYRDFSKDVGIRLKENRLVVVSGSSNVKKNDNISFKKTSNSVTMELKRKVSNSRENLKFISDETFDKLTIAARKKGAVIIRGTKEVEDHLDKVGAAAANMGDILMFRKEVCISEVLEETYHFEQNLSKVNDDKGQQLRTILNEIDAKRYMLDNAKKYKIPRNELELTEKQLQSYEKQLKEYYEEGYNE